MIEPRVIVRPLRRRSRQFLALMQASRSLHEPWISPPLTPRAFDAYLTRMNRNDHEGLIVCRRESRDRGVINLNNIVRVLFSMRRRLLRRVAVRRSRLYDQRIESGRALRVRRNGAASARSEYPATDPSINLVKRCGFVNESSHQFPTSMAHGATTSVGQSTIAAIHCTAPSTDGRPMPRTAPYGSWPSPISAELITAGVPGLSTLTGNVEALVWLESRPEEGGRSTLIMWRDGKRTELTPTPFNVRTRVHEYGGGAYLAANSHAYFVNFADQNIYRVPLAGGIPIAVTHTDTETRYADFVVDEPRARLISVGERPGVKERENCLLAVDIATGARTLVGAMSDQLPAGARLSLDGRRICFLSWDHPEHAVGRHAVARCVAYRRRNARRRDHRRGRRRRVDRATRVAHVRAHPARLDQNGFWNLYSYDASGIYSRISGRSRVQRPRLGIRLQVLLCARTTSRRRPANAQRRGEPADHQTSTTAGSRRCRASGRRSSDSRWLQGACISSAAARIASPRSRRWI
jgi:hypothetical protein